MPWFRPGDREYAALRAGLKAMHDDGLTTACFGDGARFTAAAPDRALTAKCDGCPVRELCLAYGQAVNADGIWGGEMLLDGEIVPAVDVDAEPDLKAA